MGKQHDEYWHCIIGPVKGSDLPWGADFPMRSAVENAFGELVGYSSKHNWSGWGTSDYVVDAIHYAKFHPQEIHALMAKRAKKESE